MCCVGYAISFAFKPIDAKYCFAYARHFVFDAGKYRSLSETLLPPIVTGTTPDNSLSRCASCAASTAS
jgi:hypothetical protein